MLPFLSNSTSEANEKNEFIREVFLKANMDLRGQVSTDPAVNAHFKNKVERFNFLGHELNTAWDTFNVGRKLETFINMRINEYIPTPHIIFNQVTKA